MASGLDVDVPLPAPTAPTSSLTPIGSSYPSHAAPQIVLQSAPATAPTGTPKTDPFGTQRRSRVQALRKRIGSTFAAILALIAKFFTAIKGLLLLLPKAKFLTTTGTALISVAAYSLFFGWEFAAGFVLLLFVHEMGHVFQLRREGVPASAPMFIPGLGAVVMMKSLPDDALAEARVGLAGPILGTLGAAICLVLAEALNSDLLRALAYVAFFLNLINLIPVTPFDGGRAMAAMAPAMWFLGLGTLVALFFITGNYFLLIFLLLGFTDTRRRWRQRKTRSIEQAAYYRVAPRHRLYVGAVYIALIVVLVLGMDVSHVLASGGHTFRSI
jgi:Zn-dependent protease